MEKRYHYLYQIKNKTNGMIYIGVHISNKIKNKYMGSGTNIKEAIISEGLHNFEKTILEYFDNPEAMLRRESEIVNTDFIKRTDTYNIMLGGGKLTRLGFIPVKDKSGKITIVSKNDPRYLSGELVHHTKNQATVKDKDGNCFNIDKNNPRYLSGELVGNVKGMITVKDKNYNTLQVSVNDPRYLSGELVHHSKDSPWVHNIKTNETIKIKSSELNKYLKDGWIRGRGIVKLFNKKINKSIIIKSSEINDYLELGYKIVPRKIRNRNK